MLKSYDFLSGLGSLKLTRQEIWVNIWVLTRQTNYLSQIEFYEFFSYEYQFQFICMHFLDQLKYDFSIKCLIWKNGDYLVLKFNTNFISNVMMVLVLFFEIETSCVSHFSDIRLKKI